MQAAVASAGAVPIEGKNSLGARILYHFTNKDSRASMLMGFVGVAGFVFLWWLTTEKLKLPRFEKLPGPVMCWKEFVSHDPTFGTSMFTPQYYQHIKWSCLRILAGFTIATCLGVPLGLFMGWKKKVRDYAFPILELLRPIPTMAWVPLAILMFAGREAPIIFLACLSSFFATVLNTLLGVDSIDESYFRAAKCLGASEKDVFRRVVVPGALPFIFHGPANQHGSGLVLPGRGGDALRRIRPGLPDLGFLRAQPVSGHRHGHGDARGHWLRLQRPHPHGRPPAHALDREVRP